MNNNNNNNSKDHGDNEPGMGPLNMIGSRAYFETVDKGLEPFPENSEIMTMMDLLLEPHPTNVKVHTRSALISGFISARISHDILKEQFKSENQNK